jgi:hypothetical protein
MVGKAVAGLNRVLQLDSLLPEGQHCSSWPPVIGTQLVLQQWTSTSTLLDPLPHHKSAAPQSQHNNLKSPSLPEENQQYTQKGSSPSPLHY